MQRLLKESLEKSSEKQLSFHQSFLAKNTVYVRTYVGLDLKKTSSITRTIIFLFNLDFRKCTENLHFLNLKLNKNIKHTFKKKNVSFLNVKFIFHIFMPPYDIDAGLA